LVGIQFLLITWTAAYAARLAIARRLVARGHGVCPATRRYWTMCARRMRVHALTTAPHRTTRDRSGDAVSDMMVHPAATI
jgi:hypothetical protein